MGHLVHQVPQVQKVTGAKRVLSVIRGLEDNMVYLAKMGSLV